jgi:phage gp16-like protein
MKPKPAADIRRNELAQIHIAKVALGLDDDTYRQVLWAVARVKSSAELDWTGRKNLLDHFKAKGWKKTNPRPDVAKAKSLLVSKIYALLADMKLPNGYAEGIAKQMYRREKLQWCTTTELHAIVVALVKKHVKYQAQNASSTVEKEEAK